MIIASCVYLSPFLKFSSFRFYLKTYMFMKVYDFFILFLFFILQVLMATNRPDTLDPALLRPGRLDRKVEFALPDLEGRANIFRIHARSMSADKDIR